MSGSLQTLSVPAGRSSAPDNRSLYITLQWLSFQGGVHRYHWGLLATGDAAPKGTLFHATDINRTAMDLYYEARAVDNPTRSISMVVCLKIADVSSISKIHDIVSQVPVMDRQYLPIGESRWTCRVWVKQALIHLHRAMYLSLSEDIDLIEQWCLNTANLYQPFRIAAKGEQPKLSTLPVYNNDNWMRHGPSRTTPMEIDSTGVPMHTARFTGSTHTRTTQEPYSGTKPMAIDAPYFGPKPMVIDSTGVPMHTAPSTGSTQPQEPYSGTKPMAIDSPYFGPKPMVIDSTGVPMYAAPSSGSAQTRTTQGR